MKPWPHQEYMLLEIQEALTSGCRRICVACPTGGGKTLVILEDMKRRREAALYTDRKMLLRQLADDLERAGINFGYRASGRPTALLNSKQLCMVQTEGSRVRGGKRNIHHADMAYIDEAHKNSGDVMQDLVKKHFEAREGFAYVGFTATPLGIGHFYDRLIVGATNSQLRDCGALVPAYHYGPNEPDTRWIGKVAIGDGECGIVQDKRMEFAQRVFGSVVENYRIHNPDEHPTVLFAPGVNESLWFAKELCENGIKAAHISGSGIWVDNEMHDNNDDLREEILSRNRSGDIKVICNRFVLREGINQPAWRCGIFATVFGSLTSYIQAGGRLLRACSGKDSCTIIDHGGNWWRFGSLNADREWDLEYTDRIVAGVREQRIREQKEPEPLVCPQCHALRLSGSTCHQCGYRHQGKSRPVLQKDGTLREMKGDIFRKRRILKPSERIERDWQARVRAIRNSKKDTVKRMTFAQAEVSFAKDHNWQYPPRDLPMMPVRDADWFRPICDVPENKLTRS